MTCTACGAPLSADDTQCPSCGTPTAGATASTPPPPPWGGTPPPAGGWGPTVPHPSGLASDVRGWGIAAHLAGLGGALLTVVTLGFLGPLLIWLIKREEHPFIDHHAKEALNFQLTSLVAVLVMAAAAIPVALVGILTLGVLWVVAIILVLLASVAWFVFPILGALRAANGEGFRYPISIRFVR